MRFGLFSRTRNSLVKLVGLAATVAMPLIAANAQLYGEPMSGARQTGPQDGRAMQALYTEPVRPSANGQQQPTCYDSYGNPLILPASYCQQCGGPWNGQCGCYGCSPGQQGPCCCGGFNTTMPMGCGGTDPPVGYDLMNDAGTEGDLTDQRGPHYFDVRAEGVWLHRDKSFGDNVDFVGRNLSSTPLLSSNELDIKDQVGFRVLGRYDICPLAVVEFGYTGIFDFSDSATITDPIPGNLFSLFSRPAPETGQFGSTPVNVALPGGPLPFTERTIRDEISLKSDLQTAEISYRRYWLGWSPRISGTLLAGFRYTKVDETFQFDTLGTPNVDPTFANPAFQYKTDAVNNLAGFQAGGDAWISLMQGLRVGAEGKAGIYDNHYDLTTHIRDGNVGSLTDVITPDEFSKDKPAFIGEASLDMVADITPSISLRVGYEILFLDSLVLAGDNFNQTSPFGNQMDANSVVIPRVPFVHDNDTLFYTGAHAGIEYTW
ncbi:MAG TPA: BBP7 family outer membrane beta-barrel protein [Lacipirellulaceae bacterium]|nr:BBP7 family outer membrane beta-barrel protein [Lacipirellulaceae bacterium]